MLESLTIKNFALFKEQDIQFKKGLNIILGETGSGKSLIFDAIHFVVGQKSDKTLLRNGEKSLKVDALFTEIPDSVKQILSDFEIEYSDDLLLSRTLQEDGRTSFRVNGQPVVLSMVKSFSKLLLDSLQQHEGLDLLKSKNHLAMLDKFGGEVISDLKNKLISKYNEKREIIKRISSLGGQPEERERQKELITYQINEIDRANLYPGEDDEIKERLSILSNAEKICEIASLTDKNISNIALSNINEVISSLSSLSKIEAFAESHDRLVSLRLDLEDIAETIADLNNQIGFDEIEFNKLDNRLDLIKSLKKKYGATIEDILTYSDKLKNELYSLEDSEEELKRLNLTLEKLEKELSVVASELTDKRKMIAKDIENKILAELKSLGMKDTSFHVSFNLKEINMDGQDDVQFEFSANKGQNLKNLSKTASGGEVSRLMLALKNIFSQVDGVGTLLFDEVDSGISGEVGNMVAEKLLNISKNSQVICITHLPQVAAYSDNYLLVNKEVAGDETISFCKTIDEQNSIKEIARLISGNNITETALKHANELRQRKPACNL